MLKRAEIRPLGYLQNVKFEGFRPGVGAYSVTDPPADLLGRLRALIFASLTLPMSG